MPTTEIPPGKPRVASPEVASADLYDAQRWEIAYRDLHNVPALLIQMQDELSRSRMREAFWISVVVHLVIIVCLANTDRFAKFFPAHRVLIVQPNDWMRSKELTYLEQPPDKQKITKRPDTNIISDKDRVATSRTHLDPKELQKILDSSRPAPRDLVRLQSSSRSNKRRRD